VDTLHCASDASETLKGYIEVRVRTTSRQAGATASVGFGSA
jgi:hypothetical protein